jgi:hypothetical protein
MHILQGIAGQEAASIWYKWRTHQQEPQSLGEIILLKGALVLISEHYSDQLTRYIKGHISLAVSELDFDKNLKQI